MSRVSVKRRLTRKRERENHEYARMVWRMIRAYGRRVGEADEVDLNEMLHTRHELEQAITDAVRGLRARGCSWAYIGRGLECSRQAAQMRYGFVDRIND